MLVSSLLRVENSAAFRDHARFPHSSSWASFAEFAANDGHAEAGLLGSTSWSGRALASYRSRDIPSMPWGVRGRIRPFLPQGRVVPLPRMYSLRAGGRTLMMKISHLDLFMEV